MRRQGVAGIAEGAGEGQVEEGTGALEQAPCRRTDALRRELRGDRLEEGQAVRGAGDDGCAIDCPDQGFCQGSAGAGRSGGDAGLDRCPGVGDFAFDFVRSDPELNEAALFLLDRLKGRAPVTEPGDCTEVVVSASSPVELSWAASRTSGYLDCIGRVFTFPS
jgi:hypothetical protein